MAFKCRFLFLKEDDWGSAAILLRGELDPAEEDDWTPKLRTESPLSTRVEVSGSVRVTARLGLAVVILVFFADAAVVDNDGVRKLWLRTGRGSSSCGIFIRHRSTFGGALPTLPERAFLPLLRRGASPGKLFLGGGEEEPSGASLMIPKKNEIAKLCCGLRPLFSCSLGFVFQRSSLSDRFDTRTPNKQSSN